MNLFILAPAGNGGHGNVVRVRWPERGTTSFLPVPAGHLAKKIGPVDTVVSQCLPQAGAAL